MAARRTGDPDRDHRERFQRDHHQWPGDLVLAVLGLGLLWWVYSKATWKAPPQSIGKKALGMHTVGQMDGNPRIRHGVRPTAASVCGLLHLLRGRAVAHLGQGQAVILLSDKITKAVVYKD